MDRTYDSQVVLLGIDIAGAKEDGFSIGASFASGFSEGFAGKKVGEAILGAIKGAFKDAGTLFPGGEKPSSASWLSAAAMGFALSKLGVFKLIGKGGRGLMDILRGRSAKSPYTLSFMSLAKPWPASRKIL